MLCRLQHVLPRGDSFSSILFGRVYFVRVCVCGVLGRCKLGYVVNGITTKLSFFILNFPGWEAFSGAIEREGIKLE